MASFHLNPSPAPIINMNTEDNACRLFQLISAGLPIGMYCYSQGFETAVEQGWIKNSEHSREWISGIMQQCLSKVDIPIAARMYVSWQQSDHDKLLQLSQQLIAYRETLELRKEDQQTGQALARLLIEMEFQYATDWVKHPSVNLPVMFMLAATGWNIKQSTALNGYLWSWLENQVLSAVKLVPLGQVAGQKLLFDLAADIPDRVAQSLELADEDIGGSAFALALSSSQHEIQYSRLYRS